MVMRCSTTSNIERQARAPKWRRPDLAEFGVNILRVFRTSSVVRCIRNLPTANPGDALIVDFYDQIKTRHAYEEVWIV